MTRQPKVRSWDHFVVVALLLWVGLGVGCSTLDEPECLRSEVCGAGLVCVAGRCVTGAPSDGDVGADGEDGADGSETIDVVDGADTADVPDGVDPRDGGADVDASTDAVVVPTSNACGGAGELRWDGAPASVRGPCGCGGVLTCNGTEALRCVGEQPQNVCGGCGALPGAIGTSCGDCGGSWRCDGAGGVACVGAARANGCGGCERLVGAPGRGCGSDGDDPSVWVCAGPNGLECEPESAGINACGGAGALLVDGEPAFPGETCTDDASVCGAGVLVCTPDGAALRCEGTPRNAAGGCGTLPGVPGQACGCEGVWRVDASAPTGLRCDDAGRNACGGCDALAVEPGAACGGEDAVAVCVSGDDTVCVSRTGERNACGGEATLDSPPGSRCGSCDSGRRVCAGPNRVACEGDRELAAFNTCDGTCAPLVGGVLGATCGTCGAGALVCGTGAELACEAPSAGAVRNECGGCAALAGAPGAACGTCRLWACREEGEAVQCVVTPSLPGCADVRLSCADLEPPCVMLGRACVEGDASTDAECGACLAGLVERDGLCVDESGPVRTCEEAGCAAEFRACVQPSLDRDAVCGECLDGFDEEDGRCFPSVPVLGGPCAEARHCPTGTWCPTDTSARRCSPEPVVSDVPIPFQWTPRGTFMAGAPEGEVGTSGNEGYASVTITRDVFVQRTEVTQGQWAAVVGAWNARGAATRTLSGWSGPTPAFGTSPACFQVPDSSTCGSGANPSAPVERVSWWDAVVFANILSRLEGLPECYVLSECSVGEGVATVGGGCAGAATQCNTGTFWCADVTVVGPSCTGYRLPTEAEWENAARAGTTTATYAGDLPGTLCAAARTLLDPIAWSTCNAGERTRPVGEKAPNAWGLYDMLGNVWELATDGFATTPPAGVDPVGPFPAERRTARGGSYSSDPTGIRAARRGNGEPTNRSRNFGMRLARTAP